MDKAKQLAKHEINWWKAHHRRQKDKLLREMALLYELLFELPQNDAEEAVSFRVAAADLHDQAEQFEDVGNTSKANEYWNLAERALQSHFKILLKFIRLNGQTKDIKY